MRRTGIRNAGCLACRLLDELQISFLVGYSFWVIWAGAPKATLPFSVSLLLFRIASGVTGSNSGHSLSGSGHILSHRVLSYLCG
jgi:hypothetical protein